MVIIYAVLWLFCITNYSEYLSIVSFIDQSLKNSSNIYTLTAYIDIADRGVTKYKFMCRQDWQGVWGPLKVFSESSDF